MSFQPPILKIELQHMRQSIMLALADYNSDISAEVSRALDEVVKNFDFQWAIREEAKRALQSALESYFKYGEGHKLIEQATGQVLNEALGIKPNHD